MLDILTLEKQTPQENHKEIIKHRDGKFVSWIMEGKRLLECQKYCHYLKYNFHNFEDYIESEEVLISRRHAYRIMGIVSNIIEYKIPVKKAIEIGISKMEYVPTLALKEIEGMTLKEITKKYKEIKSVARHSLSHPENKQHIEIEQWRPSFSFPMSFRDVWLTGKKEYANRNECKYKEIERDGKLRAVIVETESGIEIKDETIIEHIIADYIAGVIVNE